MVSNTWTRLSLEKMVVGSTALVLAFSVGVTFVSIVLFTRDFRLAIFATLTTVLCISTLFGIMISVLKWEFGPLEAIFLTTFVGLSVDYIVHVAHAYTQSLAGTRRQRWGKHLCTWAVLC